MQAIAQGIIKFIRNKRTVGYRSLSVILLFLSVTIFVAALNPHIKPDNSITSAAYSASSETAHGANANSTIPHPATSGTSTPPSQGRQGSSYCGSSCSQPKPSNNPPATQPPTGIQPSTPVTRTQCDTSRKAQADAAYNSEISAENERHYQAERDIQAYPYTSDNDRAQAGQAEQYKYATNINNIEARHNSALTNANCY